MRITQQPVRLTRVLAFALAMMFAFSAAAMPSGARDVSAQADPLATRVQILHAGVDTGDLEVFINGEGVLDEFSYGEQSDWLDVDPGGARLTFTADRAGFNYVVFDSYYPTPVDNDFYVVITDALVLAGAFDTGSVPESEARVQLLHASVGTPQVDVHVTGDGVDETVQLSYGGNTEAVDAAAGTYTVDVALSDGGESVLTSDLTVEAGNSYIALVIGDPGNEDHPLELVVLQTGVETSAATPVS